VHDNPSWPDRVREKVAGRTSEEVAARTWIANEDGSITLPEFAQTELAKKTPAKKAAKKAPAKKTR
jgi:hypothetical protein